VYCHLINLTCVDVLLFTVWYEPTCVEKAGKSVIGGCHSQLSYTSPSLSELRSMVAALTGQEVQGGVTAGHLHHIQTGPKFFIISPPPPPPPPPPHPPPPYLPHGPHLTNSTQPSAFFPSHLSSPLSLSSPERVSRAGGGGQGGKAGGGRGRGGGEGRTQERRI